MDYNMKLALDVAREVSAAAPYCVMLIGLPGSGKTTFRKELVKALVRGEGDPTVVSSDDAILNHAREHDLTYESAFAEVGNQFVNIANNFLTTAARAHRNIVIDQTNPTASSRQRKINILGPSYTIIGVYFPVDAEDIIVRRLLKRGENGASFDVYLKLKMIFEEPTSDEFDAFFPCKLTT